MIKNQWYIVLSSDELRDKPLGVTRFSEKLVFWRGKNNEVCCIKDKCIHRGASLCMGKVVDGEIECPFHAFKYDNTGQCTTIPANGKNSNIPSNFKASSYKTK
ncbi:Rieske 2Fe-2S domain-containing protein, partial [Romboutsia sp.]|uniref:Rieske 2Fe-2S domain-containing protein n=1 Tax=Romboutsia sp. TaxID=1965302 RepID=UPI003F2BF85C